MNSLIEWMRSNFLTTQAQRDAADRIEELTRFIEKQDSLLQEAKLLIEKAVEVRKERDELKADAVRYRWIKEQSDGRPLFFHAIGHRHVENLDAAIDEAIAKVRKP